MRRQWALVTVAMQRGPERWRVFGQCLPPWTKEHLPGKSRKPANHAYLQGGLYPQCDNTVSLLWSSSWLEPLNIWGDNLSSSLRLLLGTGVTWSMMRKVVGASRGTGFLNARNVKFKGFLLQCSSPKHRQDAWSYRGYLWPWSQRGKKPCWIILRQTFWEQTQHLPSVDFCYVEKIDTSWSHPKLSF